MQYRSLGSTGTQVSILGLGTMRLPLEGGVQGYTSSRGVDVDASIELIRHAIDCGINYLDTAFNYLHGESEKAIGKALLDGYRSKVTLATKSPIWMISSEDDFDRLLEKQMGRLQTDHIDCYLLHCVTARDWKSHVLPYGVLESLQKAKADGRVGSIGFSFHDDIDCFKQVADAIPWDFCQIQLNYLDREFQGGTQAARYAASKGMGVIVMEPLRGGHLVNPPDLVQAVFDEADPQRSYAEWAFDYVWSLPEVSVVLSGMGTPAEVDENCAYADRAPVGSLSEVEKRSYAAAAEAFASYPTIPCTGCNYCNVCPEGVTIPYNFQTYNQYIYSGNWERAIWEYTTAIPLNGAQASACTQCGTCEPRCTQDIPISEWMPRIAELFEGSEPVEENSKIKS